jgi:hypothetical protein
MPRSWLRPRVTRASVCRQLYYNQLSGAIPASLGSLTALQHLCDRRELLACLRSWLQPQVTRASVRRYLFNNQLSGTIPASLGSLTALQQLCDRRELLECRARGCGRE